RHARLEPSERRAEAEVDTLPEGDGVLDRPADVESVGVRILPLVAIRRRDKKENAVALRHSLAVPLDVAGDGAGGILRRSAVTQHLVEGRGDAGRVGQDLPVLPRVLGEEDDRVGEEPGRGLAPSRPEERAEADDLALGEARGPAVVGLDLGLEERADEAVVRPA